MNCDICGRAIKYRYSSIEKPNSGDFKICLKCKMKSRKKYVGEV